jgi:hypothetical protein
MLRKAFAADRYLVLDFYTKRFGQDHMEYVHNYGREKTRGAELRLEKGCFPPMFSPSLQAVLYASLGTAF